jgi:rhodanese-related sulfurtransferase
MTDNEPLPFEIDVQAVKQMLDQGDDFLLVDCREPAEHDTARIKGAVLMPMKTISAQVGELESRRGGRIVIHCHHGGRSVKVTQWLRQQGFSQAQNMTGGIDAWSKQIDSQVPIY